MKQGNYWANNVKEGEVVEEFMKKEIGFSDSKMVEHFCSQAVVKKDNNDDKNSPSSPSLVSQEITNSNSTRDDSTSLENSPQLNPEKDKSPEVKNSVKTIRFENKENNSQNNSAKSNDDNKVQIIDPRSIKQITLTADGNLVIEFNSEKLENGDSISQNQQVITSEQINNNQELQKIKNYCQRNGKNSLSQQELNSLINTNKSDSALANKIKNDNNNTLAIGLVAAFALIVGLVIGLVVKRKKRN
ncbi:6551_t:CDS:2 [Paraglomus brasilianum]|uniref:6551_t:CDS:1 n=1 Tax=Paraglomus brasilianum TaxID=144538 RepID=A0A9N9BI46_9GLOM|nr:6551_t:CDS:2 [Paraglomus brasilianum]